MEHRQASGKNKNSFRETKQHQMLATDLGRFFKLSFLLCTDKNPKILWVRFYGIILHIII